MTGELPSAAADDAERMRERVRSGDLLPTAGPLVAMLSGGRDSVCLLDLAVALCPAGAVRALHVNYRLRPESDADERHCRELCERLRVRLEVVRAPPPPPGNLQAWARELRYDAAARLARALDADAASSRGGSRQESHGSDRHAEPREGAREEQPATVIATGHTASDQVETILYRLAASPGRRALLGMAAREGRLVRPLLELTREQTAAYCRARGLDWREDASNDDERYARSRVRRGLVPALRAVHPAAEANVLRTARLLRAEAEVIDGLLEAELDRGDADLGGGDAEAGGGGAESDGRDAEPGAMPGISIARLESLAPALARLVVIRLAEDAAGAFVPQAGARVEEILALARRGGRAELHVGGLLAAVIADGRLSMVRLPPRERPPVDRSPPSDRPSQAQ